MTHPGFLDQPFIKVPNPHPDESIDFRAGEVIYSNPKALEWGRLGMMSFLNLWLYLGCFWPLSSMYKTHIPNSTILNASESPYYEVSMTSLDTMGFSYVAYPTAIVLFGYTLFKGFYKEAKNYVIKMQYNKTKDLVFITTMGELGNVVENCYELSNIEHMTPHVKGSDKTMSVMDKGGFMVLRDLGGTDRFYGRFIELVIDSENG